MTEKPWWSPIEDDRCWMGLIVVGILLNLLVIQTSDLGLDTHLHLAVEATPEGGEMPWGHTRTADPLASDASPYPVENGWFEVISGVGPEGVQWLVFLSLLLCLPLIQLLADRKLAIRLGALMLIHPTFIFAVGRGYPEPVMALFTGLLCYGILRLANENPVRQAIGVLLVAGVMLPMAQTKGLGDATALNLFLLAGFAAAAWVLADRYIPAAHVLTRDALNAALSIHFFLLTALCTAGIMGMGGTLSIIGIATGRFMFAYLISYLNLIGIFCLFGMVLWPFVRDLKPSEDRHAAMLAALISGLSALLVCYVAALWTYEATLWDAPWPWVMWTMGNNGRYISLLFIPAFLLIRNIGGVTLSAPGHRAKALAIGILLLLPLSLVTAAHGQTLWTADAADELELEDGEEFLLIHETTLAMHYLYTFHAPLDAADRDITGHWRAPQADWQAELDGNLSGVQQIVIAPGLDIQPPEGWEEARNGQADFLNGGEQWRILAPIAEA